LAFIISAFLQGRWLVAMAAKFNVACPAPTSQLPAKPLYLPIKK